MTFIDAKSNRNRITCSMVVAESDWKFTTQDRMRS